MRQDLPASGQECVPQLIALLREHQGNVAEVARIMGKARTQVHRWVKRFAIELGTFRE